MRCVLRLSVLLVVALMPVALHAEGQRVFSAGHSFHMFMPGMLAQLAKSAGIERKLEIGILQPIAGENHWLTQSREFVGRQRLRLGRFDLRLRADAYTSRRQPLVARD